jgi:hypothetical protein
MMASASSVRMLVVQQDAAVVIENDHVVTAPGDGPVSDGDHVPSQFHKSGCQKHRMACRLECVYAWLDEHGLRLGHPTIDIVVARHLETRHWECQPGRRIPYAWGGSCAPLVAHGSTTSLGRIDSASLSVRPGAEQAARFKEDRVIAGGRES